MTPERLAALRQDEQRAAAHILGVHAVIVLGEEDGELQPTLSLRQRVVRELRRYRPDVVICQDPAAFYSGNAYIVHPDHQAAGMVALEAVFPAARNRMYHPELLAEGLQPHAVREIYLAGTNEPNRWVDISEFIELKIQAIRAHASQLSDPDAVMERVRQRTQDTDQYGRAVFREAFRYLALR
jgi:LmbE family N-acetylglucosaminyl deacetylase